MSETLTDLMWRRTLPDLVSSLARHDERVLHRLESSSLLCQQVSTVQAFQKLVFTTSHSYIRKPHEYLRKINHAGAPNYHSQNMLLLVHASAILAARYGFYGYISCKSIASITSEGRNIQLLNDLASTPCIFMAIAFVISKSNAPVHDSFTYG